MRPNSTCTRNQLFEYGAIYATRLDFEAFRDRFKRGETMLYWRHATSIYDSMQGWFFLAADGAPRECRSWDVEIGADVSDAPSRFEHIGDPPELIAAATAGDRDWVARACDLPRAPYDAAISRLALEAAISRGHVSATLALLKALTSAWARSNLPLRHAVFSGQPAVAKALVDFGLDPSCQLHCRQSALEAATVRGDAVMLAALAGASGP